MLNTQNNVYEEALKKASAKIKALSQKVADLQKREPIAVIGMSCRFPGGAKSPELFWNVLDQEVDAIVPIPSHRWDVEGYYDQDADAPGKMYTKQAGFIEHVDAFDSDFFNISPLEAVSLDPQQRFFLEISWEALEHAGLNIPELRGSRTGVFLAMMTGDYAMFLSERPVDEFSPYFATGSLFSAACGRLSYFYDFQGPCITMDTACSSSLTALHLAVQSLERRETNLALVGGINLLLNPNTFVALSKLKALSPDGRCRSFDAGANGYGRGEGCGMIVLKRLSDAQEAGDRILAIIKGTGMSHDGSSNGLTAPNYLAQETAIREALQRAQVSPSDIDYVEAHGSATPLGDPIEIQSLTEIFKNRENKLLIGSVKSNIGHLEAAAGMAGLFKVILALQYGKIPASLHFNQPNPYIPWETIPIEVAKKGIPWKKGEKPRIAGLSSFGLMGTNVHVIIEEAPEQPCESSSTQNPDRSYHILSLSGKTETSLMKLAKQYIAYLENTNDTIADICHTSNISRSFFEHRLAIVAQSTNDLSKGLSKYVNSNSIPSHSQYHKIVFLFTGQGSIYPGIAKELYETAPIFRQALDACDALFYGYIEESILKLLYEDTAQENVLSQAKYAQPIIFSIEYALAKLWESWGIRPSLLMGHSIGEYAAACIAGIFTLEAAVKIVATRGKLVQSVSESGKMVGVLADEATVRDLIADHRDSVSIAAVNTAENVTISGEKVAIEDVLQKIKKARIFVEHLDITDAFHSVLMIPYVEQFQQEIEGIPFSSPKIPIISTMLARRVVDEMSTPAYWSKHICNTVRFYDAMKIIEKQGYNTFIEIGGTATLAGLAGQVIADSNALFVPSLRSGTNAWQQILTSLSELYMHGINLDWKQLASPLHRKKVVLPTYSFQREQYWIKELSKNYTEMLYSLDWKEQDMIADEMHAEAETQTYVIFSDQKGLGVQLNEYLTNAGASCFQIFKSLDSHTENTDIAELSSQTYAVNPHSKAHMLKILTTLIDETCSSATILYLWGLDGEDTERLTPTLLQQEQKQLTTSLLNLLHVCVEQELTEKLKLFIITQNATTMSPEDVSISSSTLWGIGRVLAVEHPDLWGRLIDIDEETRLQYLHHIVQELQREDETQICLRGGKRFVLRLERMSHSAYATNQYSLCDEKTYLVTGGLGGIGLSTARWMIESGVRHLVLNARRSPNEKTQKMLDEFQAKGVNVVVMQGDVGKFDEVHNIVQDIQSTMPPLGGIVHCAGVMDMGTMITHQWENFEKVFTAKVYGSWNLHKATEGIPLDFFIMYSSNATLGVMGQGNYAAGNVFLNVLAHYRKTRNLPALSLNWGPWLNTGMTSSDETNVEDWLLTQGYYGIEKDTALASLNTLFFLNKTQFYVLDIDWRRYSEFITIAQRQGIFSAFCQSFLKDREPERTRIIKKLNDASPENRKEILIKYFCQSTAEVAGYDDYKKVVFDKPLKDQGLDSLMFVRLKSRLTDLTNIEIPATVFFNYSTIEEIVEHVLTDNMLLSQQEASKTNETENLLDRIEAFLENDELLT